MEMFVENKIKSGAEFSECRKYRYALWRLWDLSKPLVMFIGLNPSTANESINDPTIKRVCSIAKHNGYGGIYMMNCFPFISTDPNQLTDYSGWKEYEENKWRLMERASQCSDVVFAWGNFEVVRRMGVDKKLTSMFPDAKALHINKNGSPKHPLYCRIESKLISFNQPS